MSLARDDCPLHAVQRPELESGLAPRVGLEAYRKVQRSVAHERPQRVPQGLDDADAAARELLAKARHRLGQCQDARCGSDAERDRTFALAPDLSYLFLDLAHLGLDDARAREERAAGGREHDAVRGPLQQLRVQLGLEAAYALGDRRLRDLELARAGADAARLDDR